MPPLTTHERTFARDRDRVLGSHAFRRLAGKTQVVSLPGEPLLRTRLTHTLEVASIARQLAGRLGLIESLTEAIALAHDVGHPAFGHAGEKALAQLTPGGFHHAAHGVRVVTQLEDLALGAEVVDGILKHSKGKAGPVLGRGPALARSTPEALAVRTADLVAYASHDLEDAFLLGLLRPADVPRPIARVLGEEPMVVRRTLVDRTVAWSRWQGELAVDAETSEALLDLRSFLYRRVYEREPISSQTAFVRFLFESLWEAASERPVTFATLARSITGAPWGGEGHETAALPGNLFVDTMAALTDRQALRLARDLRLPRRVRSWPIELGRLGSRRRHEASTTDDEASVTEVTDLVRSTSLGGDERSSP
jgi:dGTPase